MNRLDVILLNTDLRKAVEHTYCMQILETEILHDTGRTIVIHLKTSKGDYVLKRIILEEERLLFILAVEDQIRNTGIYIPIVLPTADGKRYFTWENQYYLMQQYIYGDPSADPNMGETTVDNIWERGVLLGQLHRASYGFSTPMSQKYMGLNNWDEQYKSGLRYLKRWYERNKNSSSERKQVMCEYLPYFQVAGHQIYQALQRSSYYANLKYRSVAEQWICHGDFHRGNVFKRRGQFWVIDWEFTRHDFPSKDLERLVNLLVKKQSQWSREAFTTLIDQYLSKNALSQADQWILYHDLTFPHGVRRMVRYGMYKKGSVSDLEELLQKEWDRSEHLKQLLD
ncbi:MULTISPECIES: phosphotransferase [Brevibacillus]|uniref:phosphotransferase n=1 Tax=Brevibacillus TaxID=55080 RepID=UPI001EF96EBC|nr:MULTISPECIES: phosphotransferase [Brevibacillus]MCG7319894.1 phosphotransferase [Brevibacillus laterosporus]MED1787146.1 phosphotransferase [Brevibacillus laterosporus]